MTQQPVDLPLVHALLACVSQGIFESFELRRETDADIPHLGPKRLPLFIDIRKAMTSDG